MKHIFVAYLVIWHFKFNLNVLVYNIPKGYFHVAVSAWGCDLMDLFQFNPPF